MKKRLFSLALALALCLGLTVPAFAAELKIVQVPDITVEEYEGKAEYGIGYFNEGLAQLWVYGKGGTKTGYIDKTGKVVIPAEYGTTGEFSEGLADVEKDGKFGYIDKTGKTVIPFQYSWSEYDIGEGSPAMFRPLDEFHEGLAMLLKDGSFGYIDKTGAEVIPCQYHMAASFSEGLALVEKDGKWGFIDKTGAEVISLQYDDVFSFSEGLAAVKKDGKWGFIDKTGAEVIPFQYDDVSSFSEGLVAVQEGGKWGYADKTGKLVIPCKYEGGATPFSWGFAVVYNWYNDEQSSNPQMRPMAGIIDKTGKEVIPPKVYTENGAEYILLYTMNSNIHDGIARLPRFSVSGGGDFSPVCFAVTADAKVSDWAREQVASAAVKGLTPDCLGDDFTVNITRAEFAALSVELYEAMSGETAPAPGESPFSDTDDPAVIQANALGIVNGKGDGKFIPGDPVTRQEAALMLSQVYARLGGEIPKVESAAFADHDEIASWAMDAVAFMADYKIVSGKGDNQFDPLGSASIQEALIIALRMSENLDAE